MKVVKVSEFGPPETLQIADAADPRPGSSAVVIKNEAIGLGSMDAMARRGPTYFGSQPGFVPGYEIAGSIIDVGRSVDRAWLGERVFAVLRQGGGCADYSLVDEADLIRLPSYINFEEAVGTGLNALVAAGGLRHLPITKSDRILVRGAGGGIGLMCVQYAALRGATIIATTSSKARGEQLLALGASSIWNRLAADEEDLRPFEIIVDTVVGEQFGSFFDKLAANGHYLICGGIGGLPPTDFGMKILEHFHKSPTLHAFSLNSLSRADVEHEAAVLFEHVEARRISPVVDSVLPLSEVVAAHHKLEAGEAFGKIILKPD